MGIISQLAAFECGDRIKRIAADNGYFAFVWVIENVNPVFRKTVRSPSFYVPTIDTEWCLELCFGDKNHEDFISFKLLRKSDNEFEEVKDIRHEFAIRTTGSALNQRNFSSVTKCCDKTLPEFCVPRAEVFVERYTARLFNSTLILQCKMWVQQVGYCVARSRLCISRITLPWYIADLCSDDVKVLKRKVRLEDSFLCLELVCGESGGELLEVKMAPYCLEDLDESNDSSSEEEESSEEEDDEGCGIDCYTCEMSLLDFSGKELCHISETQFDYHADEKITLPLTRNMLVADSRRCFMFGGLRLTCIFTFYGGAILEEIECMDFRSNDFNASNCDFFNADRHDYTSTFKNDIRAMYDHHIQCDFKIKTLTKSFSVHKSILSTRSPVFRSMISKETNDYIDIKDVTDDVMDRFLHYVYTDKVKDMECSDTLKLYEAADRYKMPCLVKKCSSMLKEKLAVRNICNSLCLAYKHKDENLKSSICDFISAHTAVVLSSSEWIKMEEEHPNIAAETLRLSCLRKK